MNISPVQQAMLNLMDAFSDDIIRTEAAADGLA